MVPVGRPRHAALRAEIGAGAGHVLSDGAGADRLGAGAAAGGTDRHLQLLALDLLHQPADRPARHRARDHVHRERQGGGQLAARLRGFLLAGTGLALGRRSASRRRGAACCRCRSSRGCWPGARSALRSTCCTAGSTPLPSSILACCGSRPSLRPSPAARSSASASGRCRSCCR